MSSTTRLSIQPASRRTFDAVAFGAIIRELYESETAFERMMTFAEFHEAATDALARVTRKVGLGLAIRSEAA